MGLWS